MLTSSSRLPRQRLEVLVDHLPVLRRHLLTSTKRRPTGFRRAELPSQGELERLEILHDAITQLFHRLRVAQHLLAIQRAKSGDRAIEIPGVDALALQRAPELTDRGRQFIARLELTKRSEQLRETSKGMLDDGRRLAVRGLAHLIAGLVALQERLAVRDNLPATMSARSPEILPPQKPAFTLSPRATSAPKPGRFVAETGKPQAARPIVASFETGAKPVSYTHLTLPTNREV